MLDVVADLKLRKKFWANNAASTFPMLAEAACRLLSMHATACAAERNWSLWGSTYTKPRNRLSVARAEKLIFIRGNSKRQQQGDGRSDVDITMSLLGEEEE